MKENKGFAVETLAEEVSSRSGIDDTAFQIRKRFNTFSKANKRIGEFLLNYTGSLTYLSITQVAEKARTSPSSVTRFCQTMGYDGFPELKYALTRNQSLMTQSEQLIQPHESIPILKNRLRSFYTQMIDETIVNLDDRLITRVSRCLAKAERVLVFSQGGSFLSAEYAQTALMNLGIICEAYNDLTLASMAAARMTLKDVAIGISSSGTTRVPIEALKIAKENKVTTVGICGFPNSEMMKYADIPLSFHTNLNDDLRYMHMSRFSEMSIISVIQLSILSSYYEEIYQNAERIKNATVIGRYNGS